MNHSNDEVPKYQKRSIKNIPSKSKHKHDYSEKILIHILWNNKNGLEHYSLGKRCIICGKYKTTNGFLTIHDEKYNGSLRMLHNDEILEIYKDCPIVEEKY